MKKLILLITLFSFGFSYDGPYIGSKESSRYDSTISKYDVAQKLFRYRVASDSRSYYGYRCEETSLKERESIVGDIKNGSMKTKKNPDYRSAIYISNDFKSGREYLYFGNLYDCDNFININYGRGHY